MQQPTFKQLLMQRYGRRDVVRGTVASLAGAALAGCDVGQIVVDNVKNHVDPKDRKTLTFAEVKKGLDDTHHLPLGYRVQVLARWGDTLVSPASSFRPHDPSPESQSQQFGFNNDFTAYFPMGRGVGASEHGLLCINHEYALPQHMFYGLSPDRPLDSMSDTQIRTQMEALGVSVAEIRKQGRDWKIDHGSPRNRRITATTPITVSGPAAGHARLQTTADPTGKNVQGTFANCAGGMTPWGTYLTCEENIDVFFTKADDSHPEARNHRRMTIGHRRYYNWERVDERFDTRRHPNEPNRFGWVVEIDPHNPDATPVKRTALGRFKHESATCHLAPDNRLVVYSGDDAKFEYIYKYVSQESYRARDPKHNRTLLDNGTLYVAKFDANGTLEWLPLFFGAGPLNPKNGFYSQADVLIETRRAADLLGATPMDRPEDVEVNPVNGKLYIVMTKNTDRSDSNTNAANRRANNQYGHIIEVSAETSRGADHTQNIMQWNMFLQAGNPSEPSHQARYYNRPSEHGWLSCPDNLAFDLNGHMWITTDGQQEVSGHADGLYGCYTKGPHRGETRHFFRGPRGCEVTGPSFTPDGRTLFLSVQHPGDEPGRSLDSPSTLWPDFDPNLPPRPAVVAITRDDGGIIGS